jgi:outer membrane protein assembly factor BamE (lipoprotein component of BamABCDE complex)
MKRITFILMLIVLGLLTSRLDAQNLNLSSSKAEVKAILGTPNRITRGKYEQTWWYGKSYIKFRDNKIVTYYNGPNLKFEIPPREKRSIQFLDLKSNKNDTLSLLGTPFSLTVDKNGKETWQYDTAFIQFERNKIIGYNGKDRLRIILKPAYKSYEKHVKVGSRPNTVIQLLGTPTHMSVEGEISTWWYGNRYVIFKDGRVKYTDNFNTEVIKQKHIRPRPKHRGYDYKTLESRKRLKPQSLRHRRNLLNVRMKRDVVYEDQFDYQEYQPHADRSGQ